MIRRLGAVGLATLFLLLAMPSAAIAHTGEESYVYLDIYDTTIEGRVEFPISDLNEVLGLAVPDDEEGALAAVESNLGPIQAYTREHLGIGDGTVEWPLVFGEYSHLEVSSGSYVIFDFEVEQAFDPVPRQFTVSYDGIIHEKTEKSALLIIGTDFGSGTFNNEASELLRYTATNSTQVVDLGDTSFWKGVTGVIGLGVEHIRIGTDHILFVFALVLPSVLIFNRKEGWQPSPTFGSALWRVLKIVTMFTVAHTITLTLGGLGLVELPAAPVETVIALSIALAAIHNIVPQFANKEWLIAFGFGLFHGFGFAGLLSDLGLTQNRRVVSLLGFNLGIELGQIVIILLLFPSLYLLRRTRYYLKTMYAASAVLAVIATGWAIDRAFGIDLQVDALVDRVILWPRSLVLALLLMTLAGGLLYRERGRNRLLPVADKSTVSN